MPRRRLWLKRILPLLILLPLFLLLGGLLLAQTYKTQNFEEPDGPIYLGNYADPMVTSTGKLTVVSYNIRYAEQIETALSELQALAPLAEADLLLLQEMDLAGTEHIARELGFNYVYAPASIHNHHARPFGNAILSRWPLSDARKIILPHYQLFNSQMRTTTRATMAFGEVEVLVYSTHTETIASTSGHRLDQYGTIAADIDSGADFVIVGGDFNTVTAGNIAGLSEIMAGAGLAHVTSDSGPTLKRYNVPAQADHIFAKGFDLLGGGVIDGSASDHEPLWARLSLVY